MRLTNITTIALAATLLLPSGTALAQDPSPTMADPMASAAPAATEAPLASATPVAQDLLALIPVEAAGLALREQAVTFSADEMRANSAEDELVVLDALIDAAGRPTEGMGVAAVFATTADGVGGIMMQAIKVPGMQPKDGVAFWTSMLDLANETSSTEQAEIAGKSATSYVSPDDPNITAYLYGADGAAWLIIASDEAMLDDIFTQLP